MKWINLCVFASSLAYLCACNTPRVDNEEIRREMESRKIHKLSDGELAVRAQQKAENIIALIKANSEKIDSINSLTGISIISYNNKNISSGPEEEQLLFNAYSSNEKQQGPLNIQYLEGKYTYLITDSWKKESTRTMIAIRMDEKNIILDEAK